MEKNIQTIEQLLEKAAEYGIISYELIKLKVIDLASRAIAAFLPNLFTVVLILGVLFFVNIGVALWIGEQMGSAFEGFFVVAAFYAVIAIVIRLFLYRRLKRGIEDYIIRQLFK